MHRLSLPWFRVLLAGAWVVAAGCSDSAAPADGGAPAVDVAPATDGDPLADVPGKPCAPQNDPDGDGISTRYEGNGDVDGDGVPNSSDADSDNDGIPDRIEGGHGQAFRCDVPPDDNDNDGTPDFLDTDANGDGIRDASQVAPSPAQVGAGAAPALDCYRPSDRGVNRDAANGWSCHPFDTDGDNVPDYADPDADGDRISNSAEIAPGTAATPTDTDSDGVPDWRDRDSDGDTITDSQEGTADRDGDMLPNYRDLDSDGDNPAGSEQGTDATEAGDDDLATGANECPRELDVRTLDLAHPMPDGIADYLDTDSDNDGLGDREETVAGTDRCNPDTDADGQLDSAEVAWCRNHMRERCATEASTRIPATDYYLILPWMGAQVARELEFGSNLRVADVYFISDTTGSMGGVLRNVQSSIATPRTGLIDSITALIPDTYFGVNHYDDFVAPGFGSGSDRPLWPVCSGPPGTPRCIANSGIGMQPTSRAMDVQATANAIRLGSGGDGPESQVEALYQTIVGDGLFDHSNPTACTGDPGRAPCWVAPRNCADGTYGHPCFRIGALPIVIHFTDVDFHNGSRDPANPTGPFSNPYSGISPPPHNIDDVINAFNARSGRIINLNASSGTRCEGMRPSGRTPGRPCYDFRVLAEGTGSVDLDGNPLIFDLPGGGATVSPAFVSSVVDAVNTIATRVPLDINTIPRNDGANPFGVDATRFIRRRTPSCQISPANDRCWSEPDGVVHADAVARTDLSTFYRVVPGTRVRFTIFFQNDNVFQGASQESTLFRAFIDVVGDGVTVLDTREVYILVPANQPPPG